MKTDKYPELSSGPPALETAETFLHSIAFDFTLRRYALDTTDGLQRLNFYVLDRKGIKLEDNKEEGKEKDWFAYL